MKKQFFLLILTLFIPFFAFGCSGAATNINPQNQTLVENTPYFAKTINATEVSQNTSNAVVGIQAKISGATSIGTGVSIAPGYIVSNEHVVSGNKKVDIYLKDGSNVYEYPWLDEGLTEYSTVLFYEKNPSYGQTRKNLIKNATNNYVFFVDIYTEVLGEIDTSMNRNLREYATEPEYVYMAYVKGLLLFENIREIVGDKKFFTSLKKYFEQCKYKNNTPDNLVGVFEDVCGNKVEKVFNSWINGKIKILKVS